ncbi:retropepsin-like aspartic protease family protein [Sphingosinicella terrae]|uniref:retropepsin-like aspartic protease family protein n=1 Tax=Sphingosinicella terrae TaxID=2172047 RepID=UPI000E0DE27B|nr:TIGR02281 family clan AA aspartic protease [Sphingosinicella terrae]
MSSGGYLLGGALLLAAVLVIAPRLPAPQAPPLAPARADVDDGTGEPPRLTKAGEAHSLERDGDGHFYVQARVNGAPVRFIVDTGASLVALTPEDAQRAGIVAGIARLRARGAGGAIEVSPITIDRLELGPLAGTSVDAVVAEDLPVSLLGQSFLSRLERLEIEDDRMTLR